MIRGTTPTLTLKIKDDDVDLSIANAVYVTLKQKLATPTDRNIIITKTGNDVIIEENIVTCLLTQEETLKFDMKSPVKVQINWTYIVNEKVFRASTQVKEINMGEQLLEKVLT